MRLNKIWLAVWCWMGFVPIAWSEPLDERAKDFYCMALTRCWGRDLEVLDSGRGGDIHARSMVAFAFRYWYLVKIGKVEKMPPYDKLIQKSFADKRLDARLSNDPLGRWSNGEGFSLGFYVDDEEYKTLCNEFGLYLGLR